MSLRVDSTVRSRSLEYYSEPQELEGDITDTLKARRADTSIRDASIRQKLREAGLQENGQYIILYAKRPVQLLKSLRSAWDEGDAVRHAETTGMLLGQLAYAPQLAVEMLPLTMDFMEKYGPQGVDGVFLSCLSAAQVLNFPLFEKGISFAEMYCGMGAPPFKHHIPLNGFGRDLEGLLKGHGASMFQGLPFSKDGMGIFVGDLSGPARQLMGDRLGGVFLLTGFVDPFRNALFSDNFLGTGSSFFGTIASSSGTFGQNLRGGVRMGDPKMDMLLDDRMSGNPLSATCKEDVKAATCKEDVKAAGTIGGAVVGAAVGCGAALMKSSTICASAGLPTKGIGSFVCGVAVCVGGSMIGISGGGVATGTIAENVAPVICRDKEPDSNGSGETTDSGGSSGGETPDSGGSSGGETTDSGGTCDPGDEYSATPDTTPNPEGGDIDILNVAKRLREGLQKTVSLEHQMNQAIVDAQTATQSFAVHLEPLINPADTMSSSLAHANVGRLSNQDPETLVDPPNPYSLSINHMARRR